MAKNELSYRAVMIGGSAGSLEALLTLLPILPEGSGAFFVIVIHRKYDPESPLVDILSKHTRMPIKEVEDKEAIFPDSLYIAPADYHLLIENAETFCLDSSEKVQYSRPSIDVSFESAAEIFGKRCVGILLSGANADGAEGLKRLRALGGFSIVQDPDSAEVGFMPQQAINLEAVDRVLPIEQIGSLLNDLLIKS